MAIGVFILVVDSPIQATWLTEDEKILAVRRLESEYPAVNEAAQHTRKQTIRAGLLNVNVSLIVLKVYLDVTGAQAWLVALAFFFISTPSLQGSQGALLTVLDRSRCRPPRVRVLPICSPSTAK
jgi:hypothetical protein